MREPSHIYASTLNRRGRRWRRRRPVWPAVMIALVLLAAAGVILAVT